MISQDDIIRFAALQGSARGGGFGGPPGLGHAPFGRGRRRRGDVRAAMLLLLAEEPRNGYQLMQAIEQRSGGRWRPSPGSVYPTLAQLEDEGLIYATAHDAGKRFELTTAGVEHLHDRHGHAPPWHSPDGTEADTFIEFRMLLAQTGKAAWEVAQVGDEQQVQRASEVLAGARRSLYRILAGDDDGAR